MNKKFFLLMNAAMIMLASCGNKFSSDASGTFETEEVIVSAEQTGRILTLNINEGDLVEKNASIGQIDVTTDRLKAEQVEASIKALQEKTSNPQEQIDLIKRQLSVQQAQMNQLQKEKVRISNLLRADAATQKQLDDINASIDQLSRQSEVTRQQLNVSVTNINTQNRSILSERAPLEKNIAQIRNQISKGEIISPIKGTILTKYAYEGEMTAAGKALFKIANLDNMVLKAYVSGIQLPQIKLGQNVKVLIDNGKDGFKEYAGNISWISSKSEFTPKTIQTKDERANLVYAIKVKVKNDGYLKIGMYGEVKF